MGVNVQTLIRKMGPEDLEQVVAIDKASFSLPWPARTFRYEALENSAARCWVAEMDGRVVAMIVLWFIVDEAHIATLATHPDFRRQGIAEQVLIHALQSAAREGARRSFLEVRAGNLAAQTMYRKYGFTEDGRRPRYYKDNGEDAILMSLTPINVDTLERFGGG
jgi:ribosomal-protein-alanine N-acetyltransferase